MTPSRCLLALAALGAAAALGGLTGCNQRTLFKDNDSLSAQRRVGFFNEYDGESAKAAADRRKRQNEWGFGPPALFGGGAQ